MKPLVSVPLVLENEAVLTRPEHLQASGFTELEAVKIVKAFCKMGEPVHLSHRLRPQLPDPNDAFVLETAFYGKALAIVTFNYKDFKIAAMKFGIQAIPPKEAWEKVRII
jgi:predicted nucleic acid-binding protein